MNVGLVGLEGHQGVILDGIAQSDELLLAAVASDDPQKLAALQGNRAVTPETRFYTDWRRLLVETALDILGICTVSSEHTPVLLAGARQGVHLLCEKPLVTTLPDLDRVRAAVSAAGVRLSMLMTMRAEPAYRAVRRLVHAGAIGEVVLATAQKSYKLGDRPDWMKHRDTFGGTIPFVGIHALDLIQWTTGCTFTHVAAWHGNVAHPEIGDMEDNASLLLRFANGGTATVRIDYLRPPAAPTHGDDRLRVAGSAGVVEVLGQDHQVTLLPWEADPTVVTPEPAEPFFLQFVRSLRGECPPLVSAEEACQLTELSLRARQAADHGTIVTL